MVSGKNKFSIIYGRDSKELWCPRKNTVMAELQIVK